MFSFSKLLINGKIIVFFYFNKYLMELLKQTSQIDFYEKVKIIVRVRPTIKGEDEQDFVEMIDVIF